MTNKIKIAEKLKRKEARKQELHDLAKNLIMVMLITAAIGAVTLTFGIAVETITKAELEPQQAPETQQEPPQEPQEADYSAYATPDKQEVQAMIIAMADEYGVNENDALRIANCESGYKHNAQNAVSSAGGVYQFIDSTWEAYGEGEKYNAYENIKSFMLLYPENAGMWECK